MFVIVLALVSGLLAGCGAAAAPTPVPTQVPTQAPVGAAALKITGNVEQPQSWTEDQVKAMPTMEAQSQSKQGETQTYTGVAINDLLALAVPKSGATGLVFVADDGYTAEVTLAEIQACADCIVSFRTQGGFSTVLPGFASSLQVKGVVEIQVK
jgi:hypothetical protein